MWNGSPFSTASPGLLKHRPWQMDGVALLGAGGKIGEVEAAIENPGRGRIRSLQLCREDHGGVHATVCAAPADAVGIPPK